MESQASERSSARQFNSGFQVWTADAYEFNLNSKKPPSTRAKACRTCRQRKIKCIIPEDRLTLAVSSQSQTACQACENSNTECRWDQDGRKRKRAVSGTNPPDDWQSHSRKRLSSQLSEDETTTQLEPGEPSTTNGSPINITSLDQDSPDCVITEAPSSTFLDNASGSDDNCFPQPVFEGLNQIGGIEALPWSDIEDFAFGMDVVEMAFRSTPQLISHSESGHNQTLQPSRKAISRGIRIRYYRRLGPTAVIPGLRKLAAVITQEQEDSKPLDESPAASESLPEVTHKSWISSALQNCCGPGSNGNGPYPPTVFQILDRFFEYFEGHFPFVTPDVISRHVRSGEASSFLINAIAALTLRFFPFDESLPGNDTKWHRGDHYLSKAKEQLISFISVPAPDVVSGLVILSWAEFGNDNEAGLWTLSGMAIRFAQDLGFHRTPETNADPKVSFHDHARPDADGNVAFTIEQSTMHQQKARLVLFWSTFILDVYVSLVTGRPPTLRRSEIEVAIPTVQDMKIAQMDFSDEATPRNTIFPETVAMMLQFSEALEVLNLPRSRNLVDVQSVQDGEADPRTKCLLRLLKSYSSLPSELYFSIDNYRAAVKHNHAGLFLTLHLFYNAFIILLSSDQRDSSDPRSPTTPGSHTEVPRISGQGKLNRSQASTMACQKIIQILQVSDLVEHKGLLSSPFTYHCLYVAASTILRTTHPESLREGNVANSFLSFTATADYQVITAKLREQAEYYGAIGGVLTTLQRREHSCEQSHMGTASSTPDEDDSCSPRMDSFRDAGFLDRYKIR